MGKSWREVDNGQVVGTYRPCRKGDENFFRQCSEVVEGFQTLACLHFVYIEENDLTAG